MPSVDTEHTAQDAQSERHELGGTVPSWGQFS